MNFISGVAEFEQQIAAIGKKVDLILGEAQSSSIQLMRDAFIAYDHKNYEEACQLFKEVNVLRTDTFYIICYS